MDNREIIKIKNLNFFYGEKEILKKINLGIPKGKITSIIGENGSGKSTLVRILAGLEKPFSGDIFLEEKRYDYEDFSEIRGDISLVFQNPNNQIIGTKVIDDLAFPLENRGFSRGEILEKIEDIAKKLEIEYLLDKDPHDLSGGEKQIVAIAGTVVFNPKVIIFDEVTSMLDLSFKRKIGELIEKLRENHTIILISHDPEETIKSDFIVYMEDGEVVLQEKTSEFYQNFEFLEKKAIQLPFFAQLQHELELDGEERGEIVKWIEKLK
ncbi:MAG: energy-coupling factor ABC transporter ATP-binding protein [Fusobacteriaceae bacterium]